MNDWAGLHVKWAWLCLSIIHAVAHAMFADKLRFSLSTPQSQNFKLFSINSKETAINIELSMSDFVIPSRHGAARWLVPFA